MQSKGGRRSNRGDAWPMVRGELGGEQVRELELEEESGLEEGMEYVLGVAQSRLGREIERRWRGPHGMLRGCDWMWGLCRLGGLGPEVDGEAGL